jgi:CRP-like cAMP-binding protein
MTATPEILRRIPMFDVLIEDELLEIDSCFTPRQIGPGDLLYQEGEDATSACFLLDGELEALKALPGGGETELGVITPGKMIGEMALVAGGARTATVRARSCSNVIEVSSYFFHAALTQMSVPAFKILRAIVRTMIGRLDELQGRILEEWDCGAFIPSSTGERPEDLAREPLSFEYRPFLSVLPCFRNFSEGEIDSVLDRGETMEVPRGEFLHHEGSEPKAAYLVLRGAVELSVMRDRRYQLAVLGPGRLCGSDALIANKPHTSDARVRAQALLLRFEPAVFEGLFQGDDTACLKFQNLISADQLMQLKAADNLLAQLISRSYVSRSPRSRSL